MKISVSVTNDQEQLRIRMQGDEETLGKVADYFGKKSEEKAWHKGTKAYEIGSESNKQIYILVNVKFPTPNDPKETSGASIYEIFEDLIAFAKTEKGCTIELESETMQTLAQSYCDAFDMLQKELPNYTLPNIDFDSALDTYLEEANNQKKISVHKNLNNSNSSKFSKRPKHIADVLSIQIHMTGNLEVGGEIQEIDTWTDNQQAWALLPWHRGFSLSELLKENQQVIENGEKHAAQFADILAEKSESVAAEKHQPSHEGRRAPKGTSMLALSTAQYFTMLLQASHKDFSRELKENKALVKARDQQGKTLLHRLVEIKTKPEDLYLEKIESTLEEGADINAKDVQKRTPFTLALQKNQQNYAIFLAQQGARIGEKELQRLRKPQDPQDNPLADRIILARLIYLTNQALENYNKQHTGFFASKPHQQRQKLIADIKTQLAKINETKIELLNAEESRKELQAILQSSVDAAETHHQKNATLKLFGFVFTHSSFAREIKNIFDDPIIQSSLAAASIKRIPG